MPRVTLIISLILYFAIGRNVEYYEVQFWQVCAKKGFLQLILLRDNDIMVYKETLMLQDITSQNSQS